MIYQHPYESLLNFILAICIEMCTLFSYSAACALAYYDKVSDYNHDKRQLIGSMIIIGSLGIMYISIVLMIFTILKAVLGIVK